MTWRNYHSELQILFSTCNGENHGYHDSMYAEAHKFMV